MWSQIADLKQTLAFACVECISNRTGKSAPGSSITLTRLELKLQVNVSSLLSSSGKHIPALYHSALPYLLYKANCSGFVSFFLEQFAFGFYLVNT